MVMKRFLRILVLICLVLSETLFVTDSSAQAASRATIMKAYDKFMKKGCYFGDELVKARYFGLNDLNNDGIPELYLRDETVGLDRGIYYWNGKKVKILFQDHNGYSAETLYKKGNVFLITEGRAPGGCWYYRFNNGKMKVIAYREVHSSTHSYYYKYYLHDVKVSESKFEKFQKKIEKRGIKQTEVNYRNTKKNRKKYLQ